MKSLKSTLSTQEHRPKDRESDQANGSLLRGVNKSKSQSLWAFEVENERDPEVSLDNDSLLRILNDKLESAYKRDSKAISEVAFEKIIEEFQDQVAGNKTEIASLMLIEDKLMDITQIAPPSMTTFNELFSSMLTAKITKMRKKMKNAELNNFENIVNCNFKKKPQEKAYFKVEQVKPTRVSKQKGRKESQSSRRASGSADKKLSRLFSKQKKPTKQRDTKDSSRKGEDQAVNATTGAAHDNSISFSAALATNITVKTRKRKSSHEKKDKIKKSQDHSQKEGDEAFMFFRPKRHKK